jgi:hypothetical protein
VGRNIHAALDTRLRQVQDTMEKEMKSLTVAEIAADVKKKIEAES